MKLGRELGLLHVFCVASGAMISSGLFILPGIAHAKAGPAVVISYLIAGFLAMTGMLSQAELVSAMPKAGGTYFYVKRSMGPAVGTVDGLITWFSLSLKSAFALVGMAAFLAVVAPVDARLAAILLCVLFTAINIAGVREAGRVQVALVTGLIAVLVFYVVRGLPAVTLRNLEPFAPHGYAPVVATAGFVFISFGGLLKVASVAEEVRDPGRTVPLAMFLSLLVVTALYLLVVFVTTGVLDGRLLDGSLTPITDGARAIMGRGGAILLSIAAILAFVSTANAGILSASRYPLALSRDGLLPAGLGRVNARWRTPHVSILITGLFMAASLLLRLDALVKAASTVLILTYLFSCLSIVILRESRLQNYRPTFRAPLYPWVQIVGIAGFLWLLAGLGRPALVTAGAALVSGLFVYWFYGRIRAEREFALLHLVERITAKELTAGRGLESELREIIRERDEIVADRFDRTIEESAVLDLDERLSVGALFNIVAETMAARLDLPPGDVLDALRRREEDSSTVLTPDLAIPHVVVEGEGRFDIMLVRAREGVEFSPEAPAVKAVFVLAGTRDERNFHLRALSAIAQIVRDPHFEERWAAARGVEGLRDVILLGTRRR
ncbi:MAG: amino acid permease [Candidatus Krumholzibacteriota bacterium]|nr:amino acid permease [Candidatus Krumholzibacteriota bacterium]